VIIIIFFSVMVIFVINNFAQETVSHKPFFGAGTLNFYSQPVTVTNFFRSYL